MFEAGLGASGRYWARVAQLLANRVAAVAYDRAGYGRSSPNEGARTLDALAADLAHVVHAQRARFVVLVGHSWGGPVVRRATELLPAGLVRELILVDPADERANVYFTRWSRVMDRIQAVLLPIAARTGLLRAGLRQTFRRALPASDLDTTVAASTTRAAVAATINENRQVRQGLTQLRAA